MDCGTCGRYRPSEEISPLRYVDGRMVMSCARCRRLAVGRRRSPRRVEAMRTTPLGTPITL